MDDKTIRHIMLVRCAECKKTIFRTDKYCMYCGKPNRRLFASLFRLLRPLKVLAKQLWSHRKP